MTASLGRGFLVVTKARSPSWKAARAASSSGIAQNPERSDGALYAGARAPFWAVSVGFVLGSFVGLLTLPEFFKFAVGSLDILVILVIACGIGVAALFLAGTRAQTYEGPPIIVLSCTLFFTWHDLKMRGMHFDGPWQFMFAVLLTPYAWGVTVAYALALILAAFVSGKLVAWRIKEKHWGFNFGAMTGAAILFLLLRIGSLPSS
jgi:hypothetical protein